MPFLCEKVSQMDGPFRLDSMRLLSGSGSGHANLKSWPNCSLNDRGLGLACWPLDVESGGGSGSRAESLGASRRFMV